MTTLTKRQFIDCPIPILSALIQPGGNIKPDSFPHRYLECRWKIDNDRIYVDKIKIIIANTRVDFLYGHLIAYADEFLPSWMFREFVDLFDFTQEILDCVYKVENILYILNFIKGRPIINMDDVEPRKRLRELLPWYESYEKNPNKDYPTAVDFIMGDSSVYGRITDFKSIRDIIRYGDGSARGFCMPYSTRDFLYFSPRLLEKMLIAGWIITIDIEAMLLNGHIAHYINIITDIIISRGLSYFLFDEHIKWGPFNIKASLLKKDYIGHIVEKDKKEDPEKYNYWLTCVKKEGCFLCNEERVK